MVLRTKSMKKKIENRRQFIGRIGIGVVAAPLLLNCRLSSRAQTSEQTALDMIRKNAISDPGCNWCGAKDVPTSVSWKTSLSDPTGNGKPIKIAGTVYQADGKTPAGDTLIYFYHTDTEGIYGRRGQHRHGHFRGWLLTDKKGRYEFDTIMPASYPNSRNPAHIHMTVTDVDRKEDWIDSILFEGDPFITSSQRRVGKGGFNPILSLGKDPTGKLVGLRDIMLERV